MKLLCYSSAAAFGGHELMSLKGLEALLGAGHLLVVVCYAGNAELCSRLVELQKRYPSTLRIRKRDFRARSFQVARTWTNLASMVSLLRLIRSEAPDRILALQGDIEQGSEIFLPARLARTRLFSYIPMIMSGTERNIRMPAIRDALSRPLYRLASRFLVISSYFGDQARARAARDAVVVSNCVDDAFVAATCSRSAVRASLGIDPQECLTGFVGRISYQQKGLDRLLAAMRLDVAHFRANRVLIVGDGPDLPRLRADLAAMGLEDCVILRGWSNERVGLFDAMDAFVCVSRFEGVPLTILEALTRGVPVVSVPLPSLVSHLPLEFVDDEASAASLLAGLKRHVARRSTDGSVPTPLATGFARADFDAAFVSAVTS